MVGVTPAAVDTVVVGSGAAGQIREHFPPIILAAVVFGHHF